MVFLRFFFTILDGSSKRVLRCPKIVRRDLSLENCSHKMNVFIPFLVSDRDALVKQSIETAIKICEKQEIPIKERRVQRKKKMPGEYAEDVGLSVVEGIKRCILEAKDRFWSEAEKRFSEICMLNEVCIRLLKSPTRCFEAKISKYEQI